MAIVVVEDEASVRELLARRLEDEGYEVLPFADPIPVTALKPGEGDLDLFLIDIVLPEINGIALAARLRDEGFGSTPKIAMSASERMLRVAEESGLFHGVLTKPFDLDLALNSIRQSIAPQHSTTAHQS